MSESYSIRSEYGKKNKERLFQLLTDAGYETYSQFCADAGLNQSNLYSNLDGTWKMSLKRMFKIANMLGVPIVEIIGIFYPEELEENMRLL